MNKVYIALGLVTLIGCGSSSPAGGGGAGGSGGAGLSPGNGASGGSSTVCAAGQQVACPCVGGIQGAQTCKADGSGYLACDCTMNSAGGTSAGGSAGMSNAGGGSGASGDAGMSGAGGTGGSSVGGGAGASGSSTGGVGGSASGGVSGGGSGGTTAGTGGGGAGGSGGAAPVCGNSVIESGETCDDGNKNTEACAYGQKSCTVCSSTCKSVAGATSYCGDGAVEAPEACDDGNATAGDGCSATCTVETGFACTGTPSACNRSCNGLAKICGHDGNADCCASNVVKGTTTPQFYRSYDNVTYTDKSYPATVSDFRFDNYEITVGRFRKFVAAYSRDMIAQGAGKNPNNPADPGWDAANWNARLEGTAPGAPYATDRDALEAALNCGSYQTWSDAPPNVPENRAMNCLDWYEAEAFCIWDGGRLPTEAEWNYAAAGGTQQRVYPWGSDPPDCAHANFGGSNFPATACVNPGFGAVNRVGSESPTGDGYYGQADLTGNVWEWVQDWYASPYSITPCNNCADLTVAVDGVFRGGDFDTAPSNLYSSFRLSGFKPTDRTSGAGARCARSASSASCNSTSQVTGVMLDPGVADACRGAITVAGFSATSADASLTCCGTSTSSPTYSVEVDGDGTQGVFELQVPDNAPLGMQSINVSCGSGSVGSMPINVVATPAPVVTSATLSRSPSGVETLTINGAHLNNNSSIRSGVDIASADGSAQDNCTISSSSLNDATTLTCTLDTPYLPAGSYSVDLVQGGCGYAVNSPVVVQP